jgi:ubiquinone/menaquinone biosynthesis C-methylase UbiE
MTGETMGLKNSDKAIYYEDWWHTYSKQMNADNTLALHSGYYEKGIRTHEEAVINKNRLIEKLLDLNNLVKKNGKILDAGCGVGGTSIFLAKNHSNIKFIGINNNKSQIYLASKFAQEHNVTSNTEFIMGDHRETKLPADFFDGIFALEALTRTKDKIRFLREAFRILKKNKKLVIDDAFLIKKPSNYITKKAYSAYCITWNIPFVDSLDDFKNYLKDLNFGDIKIIDITKNSRFSFFIINLKFLFYAIFSKSKIKRDEKKNMQKNDKSLISTNMYLYIIILFFSSMILLLNRNIGKIVITAIKK